MNPIKLLAQKVRPKAITERIRGATDNREQYEAYLSDRARKIDQEHQLLQAFTELKAGKLPSNAQLEQIMQSITPSSIADINALSSEGRRVATTLDQLNQSIRRFIADKNQDESVQAFLHNYTKKAADIATAQQAQSSESNLESIIQPALESAKQMQSPVQMSSSALIRAISTVLTNAGFRNVCGEYITAFIESAWIESDMTEAENGEFGMAGSNDTQQDGSDIHKTEDFIDPLNLGESFQQSLSGPSTHIDDTRMGPQQTSSLRTLVSPVKQQRKTSTGLRPSTPTEDVAKHGRDLSLTRSVSGTPTRVNSPLTTHYESDTEFDKMTAEENWRAEGQRGVEENGEPIVEHEKGKDQNETDEQDGQEDTMHQDQLSEAQRNKFASNFQRLAINLHSKPEYTRTLKTIVSFVK